MEKTIWETLGVDADRINAIIQLGCLDAWAIEEFLDILEYILGVLKIAVKSLIEFHGRTVRLRVLKEKIESDAYQVQGCRDALSGRNWPTVTGHVANLLGLLRASEHWKVDD